LCLQRGSHMNPQVMQTKKCWWSHNLMKRGDTCERWPRPTLKRRTNGTKILWTNPDERWILKKEMKCGWTLKKFGCQKVWATSSWAHIWVHSRCWKRNFLTFTNYNYRKILKFIPHFMFHFWSQSPVMP
jgi:hypothetical protein